jgi:hypothetical protein
LALEFRIRVSASLCIGQHWIESRISALFLLVSNGIFRATSTSKFRLKSPRVHDSIWISLHCTSCDLPSTKDWTEFWLCYHSNFHLRKKISILNFTFQ